MQRCVLISTISIVHRVGSNCRSHVFTLFLHHHHGHLERWCPQELDLLNGSYWVDVLALSVMTVLLRLIGYFVLRFKLKLER